MGLDDRKTVLVWLSACFVSGFLAALVAVALFSSPSAQLEAARAEAKQSADHAAKIKAEADGLRKEIADRDARIASLAGELNQMKAERRDSLPLEEPDEVKLKDITLPPSRPVERRVTMAAFSLLDTGMRYSEVEEIIGFPGELTAKSDVAGILCKSYSWRNSDGSNMLATFTDGRLSIKAQYGLK